MKYVILVVALFILLVIQTGLLPQVGLDGIGNLILLFVIVTILFSEIHDWLPVAIIAGLALDLASSSIAGTATLAMIITGFAIFGLINKVMAREANQLILLICASLGTIIFSISFLLINKLLNVLGTGAAISFEFVLGRKLLFDLIFNLVLIIPIFYYYQLTQKIYKRING